MCPTPLDPGTHEDGALRNGLPRVPWRTGCPALPMRAGATSIERLENAPVLAELVSEQLQTGVRAGQEIDLPQVQISRPLPIARRPEMLKGSRDKRTHHD